MSGQHVTNVLSSLSKDYDKNVRPNYGGGCQNQNLSCLDKCMSVSMNFISYSIKSFFWYVGSGVTVGVTAYILSMDSLSEENMVRYLVT